MTEAKWGEAAKTPDINWRMSASLENVPHGDTDIAEVTTSSEPCGIGSGWTLNIKKRQP